VVEHEAGEGDPSRSWIVLLVARHTEFVVVQMHEVIEFEPNTMALRRLKMYRNKEN
jgi:hypothetical protein